MITYTDNDHTLVSCPQNSTIERTWTATDDCGNASTCLQIIDVADDTPPVITCPADVNLDCTDSTDPSNTGEATATDDCDTSLTISYTDNVIPGPCPQASTIERTWTCHG